MEVVLTPKHLLGILCDFSPARASHCHTVGLVGFSKTLNNKGSWDPEGPKSGLKVSCEYPTYQSVVLHHWAVAPESGNAPTPLPVERCPCD